MGSPYATVTCTCCNPHTQGKHSPHPLTPPPSPPTPHTEIDREVTALQREEQKLIRDIKAAAKTGNTAATRVLAKSLVRLRGQITSLKGSSAQLRGVSTNLTVSGLVWAAVIGCARPILCPGCV